MAPKIDSAVAKEQGHVWKTFSRALGADLREHQIIQGVSGLKHPVQAIAVDDKTKRVLIFSAEPNPRVAALMQVDVQATMPDARVLVARPILFDLGVMTRKLFKTVDDARFNAQKFQDAVERIQQIGEIAKAQGQVPAQLETYISPIVHAFSHVALPGLSQIIDVLQQFSHLDWPDIFASMQKTPNNVEISFASLMEIDTIASDRNHGICPLPLYEFSEQDWELFLSGKRIVDVQERLKELDIFQYFFPPADQLALGVVERGMTKASEIIETIERAPKLGHPLTKSELLPTPSEISQVLEQLDEQGYVAEGEYGVTATAKGVTARAKIKFRPREGLLTKLLNRVSAKINLSVSGKDFI